MNTILRAKTTIAPIRSLLRLAKTFHQKYKNMKNLILLLTLISLLFGCEKETTPPPYVNNNQNTPPDEELADYTVLDGYLGTWDGSTILSADGNVITVGRTKGFSNFQMLLIKTNTNGEEIFSSVFHEENSEALGVYEDGQGNLYVVGKSYEENSLDDKMLAIAKLDSSGNLLWKNAYHSQENITGYHITGVTDNEIIISGSRDSDLVFLKIDSLGQELFFDILDSSYYGTPSSMLVLQNENILITGTTTASEIHLTCFDNDFNFLWEKKHGSTSRFGRSTIQLDNGDLITVGKSTHVINGSNVIDFQKVIILKTDNSGELIWENEVGDIIYHNDGQAIAENEDGTFVLTGYALSGLPSNTDHMLIHIDSEGNEINAKYFTDSKTFRGENIIKTEDGKNVITGGYQGGIFFLNVDNEGL